MPAAAPTPCTRRAKSSHSIEGATTAMRLAATKMRGEGQHDRPAADGVRDRPADELRGGEAAEIGGQRQLHGGDVGAEDRTSSGMAGV